GFIIVGLAGIIGYCFVKVLIRVRPIIAGHLLVSLRTCIFLFAKYWFLFPVSARLRKKGVYNCIIFDLQHFTVVRMIDVEESLQEICYMRGFYRYDGGGRSGMEGGYRDGGWVQVQRRWEVRDGGWVQ
ncbi:14082_t:CDS:2, partial [Acaulospora morrowiae]